MSQVTAANFPKSHKEKNPRINQTQMETHPDLTPDPE